MTLRLEELQRQDFPIIRDWIDPDIFRIFKSPIDDQQLERLLSKKENGQATDIGMGAVNSETSEFVGLIHAVVNRENNYAHIQQIVVNPNLQNKGYGTAILMAFLGICFDSYNFHRVQLFTEEDNAPAIACYKKAGFHIDGILRDINKTDSGYLSTYVFSMLHDEWGIK